jgi:hypothetical protein
MIDYCVTCGARLPLIHGARRIHCLDCHDALQRQQSRRFKLRRKMAQASEIVRRALAQRETK